MNAPLVVNTKDGTCWTRRTVTRGGVALYAPESVQTCPNFVMATLAELAEHGIVGSADALLVPVGDERTMEEKYAEHAAETTRLRDELAKALEQAAAAHLRVTELEVAATEGRAALAALCHDLDDPGSMALGALYLLQQATPGTPMEPGEIVPKAYRASHDSIVMDLYLTPAAAREHCEAEERRAWPTGTSLVFDWIEDDEDGVAELVVTAGQNEESTTGYVVTALDIATRYDEGADE
jgi:hypothetical protein